MKTTNNKMPFRYLEDITLADVAFEATGQSIPELLEAAGEALTSTMIDKLDQLSTKIRKEFRLNEPDVEKLLFNFLEELIFYKDTERLLFKEFKIEYGRVSKAHTIHCRIAGDVIDTSTHDLLVDVKAVTMHKFSVTNDSGLWRATVVLDV